MITHTQKKNTTIFLGNLSVFCLGAVILGSRVRVTVTVVFLFDLLMPHLHRGSHFSGSFSCPVRQ
jgi:hypothetical protein